jgi:hypothetical protein
MKKLTYGMVSLAALCAVLMLTPLGVTAQQAVRATVTTEASDSALMTATTSIQADISAAAASLDNIETNMSEDAVGGNTALTTGPQGMLMFDDSSPTSVSEGQARQWRGSAKGDGYFYLRDAAGNERGANVDASNRLTTLATISAMPDEGQQVAASSISVTFASDKHPCADASQVSSAVISTASSGNVELVAISGSTIVYVCGFDVTSQADVSIQFVSGTGTACATGETNKTGVYPLVAASGAGLRGIARTNGGSVQFKGAAGEAMCIELSGAVQVDGLLTYVQR